MAGSRTQVFPPSPELAPYVHAVVVRRPSPEGPCLPEEQRFAASLLGGLTVLHSGEWLDGDTGQSMAPLEFAGPRLIPARRRYANDPAITTVLLRPGVLNWLFASKASDWVDQRRPAGELIGVSAARSWLESVHRAAGTANQVWVVEQLLRVWIDRAEQRKPWAPPLEVPVVRNVAQWTATSSWSSRQLNRHFGNRLGVSPKAILRIERLQRSMADLASGMPLAQLAPVHGFSNAAHVIREFRFLAGISPAEVRDDLKRHEGLPWFIGFRGPAG